MPGRGGPLARGAAGQGRGKVGRVLERLIHLMKQDRRGGLDRNWLCQLLTPTIRTRPYVFGVNALFSASPVGWEVGVLDDLGLRKQQNSHR
jgi:hypothetical protein